MHVLFLEQKTSFNLERGVQQVDWIEKSLFSICTGTIKYRHIGILVHISGSQYDGNTVGKTHIHNKNYLNQLKKISKQ